MIDSSVPQREALVFCLDQGDGRYGWFWQEADVLLLGLGNAVEEGKHTVTEMREAWWPYERLWPTLYEGEPEEWWEAWWGSLKDDLDLPVSTGFWDEAHNLGIPSVGFLGKFSGSTDPIFEVQEGEALRALREAMAGRYRILVKDDLLKYADVSLKEAKTLIAEGRGE
jgi:hypothetical protein